MEPLAYVAAIAGRVAAAGSRARPDARARPHPVTLISTSFRIFSGPDFFAAVAALVWETRMHVHGVL